LAFSYLANNPPKREDKMSNGYTHGEARTNRGALVKFTCDPEIKEEVITALGKLRNIHTPTTHEINMGHGCYGKYSRYNLKQHRYAGYEYGIGYEEVIEIRDAPDGRCPFVIWREKTDGVSSVFYEFETLQDALFAWDKVGPGTVFEKFQNVTGLIRHVPCSGLDPWFYAVGEQTIYKDFAFPDWIKEDPTFRILKKYVVEENGFPTIKTCLGLITINHDERDSCGFKTGKKKECRIVYWDDGTCWDERYEGHLPPRRLEADELWIADAIDKFRDILSGKKTEFSIEFQDGSQFVGRLVQKDVLNQSPAGTYLLRATLSNGRTITQTIDDFRPTKKTPTVRKAVERAVKKQFPKAELISLDIQRFEETLDHKGQWSGVYAPPSK